MTRLEYLNSLIDLGLSSEEIQAKLEEWDLENAAETDEGTDVNFQTGVANAGANEAPSINAPKDMDSNLEDGSSVSAQTSAMPSRGNILTNTEPTSIDDLSLEEINELWRDVSYRDKQEFARQRGKKYRGNSPGLYDDENLRLDKIDFYKNIKTKGDNKGTLSEENKFDISEEEQSKADELRNNYFERVNNPTDSDREFIETNAVNEYFYLNMPDVYARDSKLKPSGEEGDILRQRWRELTSEYNRLLKEGVPVMQAREQTQDLRDAYSKRQRFKNDDEYNEYLKNVHFKNDPDLYEEYIRYKKEGILPNQKTNDKNELENFNNPRWSQSEYAATTGWKSTTFDQLNRGVDDKDVQEAMRRSGFKGSKFKDAKQAEDYLFDKSEDGIVNYLQTERDNLFNMQEEYEEAVKPFTNRIGAINKEIELLMDEDGNFKDIESVNKAIKLAEEQQKLILEATSGDTGEMAKAIVFNTNNLNDALDQYRKDIQLLDNAQLFQNSAAKDYTFTTRAGMALEDFFIGDMYYNFGALLKETAIRTKYAGLSFAGEPGKKMVDAMVAKTWESAVDYNKKLDAKRQAILPADLKIADIGDNNIAFFDWFGEAIANNSPSIVTGFIPGGGALGAQLIKGGVTKGASFAARRAALKKAQKAMSYTANTAGTMFFLSESGTKAGDLELNRRYSLDLLNSEDPKINLYTQLQNTQEGTLQHRYLSEEIKNAEQILDYNFAQKAFTSYAYGGSAALFERFGSIKWVQDASSAAFKAGRSTFKGDLYRSVPSFIKGTLGKTGRGVLPILGGGLTIEQIEELGTQLTHNFLDIAVLGEEKSMLDGIDGDFFANNAVTILGIGSPTAGVNIVNTVKSEFRTREEALRNQDISEEIDQINYDLKKLKGKPRTEALKRRRQLFKELALSDFYSVSKLKMLADKPGDLLVAADAASRARSLNNNALALGRSGGVTETDKKELAKIKEQYKEAIDQKEEILGQSINGKIDKTLADYREKLGIDSKSEMASSPELMYNYGLYQSFSDAAMTMLPSNAKYIVIKDPKNIEKELKEQGVDEAEIAEIKQNLQKKVNGKDVLTILQARGTITSKGNLVVNEQAIVESLFKAEKLGLAGLEEARYAAAAPLEELFHLRDIGANIVDKKGRLNKKGVAAVKDAKKVLERKFKAGLLKLSQKEYDALQQRFKLYEGKKKYARTDYEEILAQMNNAVLLGVLKPQDLVDNPSIGHYVRGMVKNIMGDAYFMYELNSPDNVFRFLQDFQRAVQNQQRVKTSQPEEELTKEQKAFENNKIAVDNLFEATPGQDQSKDEVRNEQAFTEAFDRGLLDSAIRREFEKVTKPDGQELPGIDSKAFQDFKQSMYLELLPHARGFDSSVNDSFFGWLMGFKGFKALNVIKKKGVAVKEKYESDITDPVFGNMVATDVNTFDLSEIMEDIATYVEVTLDENGKVKLRSDLFDESILKEIQNITEREIKLAKNQIYQAYSKNKKVNPFVGELKKALQKQADIIVRKAMGKMSDKSYETFLKKHKATILNNSTKTYLSKFLPEAVLKSVGGRKVIEDGKVVDFIPNFVTHDVWGKKGTKIDKEIAAVHGRTAQHQIMKKDPNFEISDQDWINIFIKNGKAIGSKKESIAKQIAFKVGFDMFRAQAQLDKGKLLDAFKINMELKDVLLKENYVAELGMQLDMGEFTKQNKAFSDEAIARIPVGLMGETFTNTLLDVMGIIDNKYNGNVDAVVDEDGEFRNLEEFKDYPRWAAIFAKEVMAQGIRNNRFFIQSLKALGLDQDIINEFDKNQENLGSKKTKGITSKEREHVARLNKVVAKELAPVLDVIGLHILSYHNNYLDSAEKKVDKVATQKAKDKAREDAKENNEKFINPGRVYLRDKNGRPVQGTYYKNNQEVLGIVQENKGKEIPQSIKEDLKYIKLFNSQSGIMQTILRDIYSVEGTENQLKKLDKYKEEITRANTANDNIIRYIGGILKGMYNTNKIDANYVLHILQSQTSIKDGIRALSKWDLIDIDGIKRTPKELKGLGTPRAYGEHMLANVRLMSGLAKGILDKDVTISEQISKDLIGFTQLATFSNKTKKLDNLLGKANPNYDIDRINSMGPKNISTIYSWDGIPYREFRAKQMVDQSYQERIIAGEKDLSKARIKDQAIKKLNASFNVEEKGITVLDFDDTLAFSDSKIIVIPPQKLQGLSKIGKQIEDNRMYGPNNAILRNRFEQELKDRFKAIEDLEVSNSAEELRTKLKKAKGEEKENIQLALEEKFSGFKDEVALSGIDVTTGKVMKITPAEFAKQAGDLELKGYTFDFSEFNDVKKGRKGPMFDLALKRQKKFGSKDIYVLTARPQASARAIQKFAKSLGLHIPLKNITGLEDGTPKAKADWITSKVAEGYNNFYFADDAIKNVQAVQEVLDKLDVKSDVQQAKLNKGFDLSNRFNQIIQEVKGVRAETVYSDAAASMKGKKREGFFLPPSAEDFEGLIYSFLGKGKKGEEQYKFFKENLLDPFARGHDAINRAKQQMDNDYAALKKQFPEVHKKLKKETDYNNFTFDQAVRIYIWSKTGQEVPGLSKRDSAELIKIVRSDKDLKTFADSLMKITKAENNWAPTESWLASTIGIDMLDINHSIKRKEHLAEWIKNKNEIFNKDNLNKIEAVYGTPFREALEDILYRMEKGTNRNFGRNKMVNEFMDWMNGSVGVIMFFNTRSAVLQGISFANFVNWGDNNMLKAGAAFANQPQFWKDFAMIFNSDFLKQRRSGLRQDINWQEIADHVRKSKNKTKAAIHWMLQKGFLPTQMMDSFAIALGGASMFRNRTETYLKQGLTKEEAEAKAFVDFQEIAEKTQQSSRPDLISQQQASPLGRVILAFQNVTMQYNRQGKKAVLDLINRRGSDRTNVSKALYYFGLQNLLFHSLQQALFAMLFDDETEEEELEKYQGVANGMSDTILRGMGIKGAIVSTLKNMIIKFNKQNEKPSNRADYAQVLIEALNLSPPLGSKARRVYSALNTYKFNKDEIADKSLLDPTSPVFESYVNLISAGTNAPTDKIYYKIQSLRQVMDSELASWQRIAIGLGWRDWQVGVENERYEGKTLVLPPSANNGAIFYKPMMD